MKKILITFLIIISSFGFQTQAFGAQEEPSYAELRSIDIGTFNEYRYKITELFFELRNNYEVYGELNDEILSKIDDEATKGYNYLPDNLYNKDLYNKLITAINKGKKEKTSSVSYSGIVEAIQGYLEETRIDKVKGSITVSPNTGNAPLTVTLRGNVTDPTGTKIPDYNYTWWIDNGGQRVVIGQKPSINYTLNQEGNFTVFLDVKSNHKNDKGNIDTLSFRSRAEIEVKEKVASLIMYVNGTNLGQKDEIKLLPDEGKYGIVFDATSSTPTGGTKFKTTKWDFGNGIEKEYDGGPKVERIKYLKEGDYTVKLELKTNELKTIKKNFLVSIHQPIASINVNKDQGFLEEKFTFSATPGGNDNDLDYTWTIIDIENDKEIFETKGSLFTYNFTSKGKFNVKLEVIDPAGEKDQDNKIIFINSRAPIANFNSSIPLKNKPNTIFLDATKSYDPDHTDEGKLKFSRIIDGERVSLNNPNLNGSNGYHTFDSIGEHSVILEVTDPDGIKGVKKSKINIDSILAVDFSTFPRVIQRNGFIRFVAWSPEAQFFEWDFGDGKTDGGTKDKINHSFDKSGIYEVELLVRDKDNKTNSFSKIVYVGDSNYPVAHIEVKTGTDMEAPFSPGECGGEGAYIVNRVVNTKFDGGESINIDGETSNLEYTWLLGKDNYYTSSSVSYRFDELGCFPMKLTVKNKDNGKKDETKVWVKVENIKPTLSSLDVSIVDIETDPVVVNVRALGSKDEDGVIQSYLWYYYTDIDQEAQDFRATNSPSTTFVIPKVSGNYYFVVVMKDSNEQRVNSEELTGSRYFITLTGDNINTPLINLTVNDSSVLVGEEVVFKANVKNILGQDISKKSNYSWDFDGDGFYDMETTIPEVSYKYPKGGEYFAKVKVKYKGASNTKSITINTINKLVADFSYVSVGDKYIFFNKSSGSYSNIEWNMGDGEIIEGKENFEYDYTDGQKTHNVILRISEGTKISKEEKKVVSSIKNRLKVKKDSVNIFSDPKIEDSKIILNEEQDVFLYLGLSSGDFKYYGIDTNINYDSDLNGTRDDDIDNKNDPSYLNGGPIKINLNNRKEQTLRTFTIDESGNVVDSKDIKIIKNYVSEKDVDIGAVTLTGATEDEIRRIELLRELLGNIDNEDRLKAKMYLNKLQEERFDNTEKTRVIIEFETYIEDLNLENGDDIIEILESFLIEDGQEKTQKTITYNALKNLVPQNIKCEYDEDYSSCYGYMISLLEEIKDSDNLEGNKKIGSEILNIIGAFEGMSDQQKLDFKAILKSYIYGGNTEVPDDELPSDVNTGTGKTNDEGGGESKLLGLIKGIFFWLAMIILFIVGAVFLYWLYYKLTNNDEEMGFQDFIIDRTSDKSKTKEVIETEDILSLDDNKKEDKSKLDKEKKVDNKKEDLNTKNLTTKNTKTENLNNIKNNKDTIVTDKKNDKSVPDRLSKSFVDKNNNGESKSNINNIDNKQKEKTKTTDEKTPDRLAGSLDDKKDDPKKTDDKKAIDDKKADVNKKDSDEKVPDRLAGSLDDKKDDNKKTDDKKDNDNKKDSDDKVPDWLAGSLDDKKDDLKKTDDKKDNDNKKDSDDKVPDWLAGSLDDKKDDLKKTDAKKAIDNKKADVNKKDSDDKVPDRLAGSLDDKKEVTKKTDDKKASNDKKEVTKKTDDKKASNDKKADDNKKDSDDKVPDRLAGSLDDKKDDNKKTDDKKASNDKKADDNKKDSDDKVPDRLAGSLDDKKDDPKKTDDKKADVSKKDNDDKVPDRLAGSLDDKKEVTKKTDDKKSIDNKKSNKAIKDEDIKTTKDKKSKTEDKKGEGELWDDGMDVPERLKGNDDNGKK